MTRTVEDLKALLMAADEYRETVNIEYLGEIFAVPIRPLTESEITDVNRQMKISMKLFNKIKEKVKVGKELTAEEKKAISDEALDAVLSDESLDMGDLAFTNFLIDRAYCMKGIVDDGLRTMVPKFRYGLTEMISKRIQTISNVPPEVVANFFGPTKASSSS